VTVPATKPFAKAASAIKPDDTVPPIFPCRAGAKEPATTHGHKDAARTHEDLKRLAREYPDANIGFALENAGLCVVDIDGPEGENSLALLELQHGAFPATREVKTPHGRHLYFRGTLPPSVSKIGPHIDTRGRGSYVLAPGSIVNGVRYEATNGLAPAELPEWIRELVTVEPDTKHTSAAKGDPVDGATLREALSFLDPGEHYEGWRNIVAGIGAANCAAS